MLDNFLQLMMDGLIQEMTAITDKGEPDHKTRLNAIKEARCFVVSVLPKLNEEDREKISHTLTQGLQEKLAKAIEEEIKLKELNNAIETGQKECGTEHKGDGEVRTLP